MSSRTRISLTIIVVGLLVALIAPSAAADTPGPAGRAGWDRSLVAWWDFNRSHNDRVADCVRGGMHGTNHGAEWTDGALEFDGVDDCVDVRQFRRLASVSTGTISVWFNFHSVRTGEVIQPIFYYGDADGGADNTSLIIEIGHFWPDRKTCALYFTIFGVPGQKPTFCFDTTVDLSLNAWHHFVAVVGEDFNTGYLDGAELTGRNYNFGGPYDSVFLDDVPNPGICVIGKGYFANFSVPSYFDGSIGDVRIYDRPLDADEVEALYDDLREGQDLRPAGARAAAATGMAASRPGAGGEVARPVALIGIVPNPFNPATSIRFSVAERTRVTLRIFNAEGRLVAKLLEEVVGPGLREIAWDGTDGAGRASASGVYFARLDAGGRSSTGKLVLGR